MSVGDKVGEGEKRINSKKKRKKSQFIYFAKKSEIKLSETFESKNLHVSNRKKDIIIYYYL